MLPLSVVIPSAPDIHTFLHQGGFKILTNTKGAAIIWRVGILSRNSMITMPNYCQDQDKNVSCLVKANREASLGEQEGFPKLHF